VMRKMMTIQFLLLAVSLLMANPANAQEKGQTGVTMGYPASVGLVWHPSDAFALRPELSLSTSSFDSSSSGERDTSTIAIGLSGLFYLGKWESLSAYLSPRFTYSRLRLDGFSAGFPDNESKTYAWSGSFGTQYALHRKFSVFGEVGVAYSHSDEQFGSTLAVTDSNTDTWSTRTGVGVLFYF
jgi:hypothetical protein